jgi:hypothetical protein
MRALGTVVFFVWLFASGLSPARAQTAEPALDRNAHAVEVGQRGLEAFRVGAWQAAYQAFHEAEATAHSPVFLLYMARVRQRQGATAEALDLYTRVAAEPATNSIPDSWRAAIDQATLEAAELRVRIASSTERPKPALAPVVRSNPARRREPEQATPSTQKIALSAAAVGAAGLLLGASAGIVAKIRLDRLEANCTERGCDPADKPKLEAVRNWERVANIGFIVAGTGLATAGVFLWLVPEAPTRSIKARTAGISARWRF